MLYSADVIRQMVKTREEHESMIKAGQAKLAETKLVPGSVKIWC